MTTFSPITGYGLAPETIGAAPTNVAPLVGSAAIGAEYGAPLPPDPTGGGAIPNAAVPTGYDTAGAYLVDGAGNYIQPPVTDMGVAGPATLPATAATSSAGGPGASGWNAEYGMAFAQAFQAAGVAPDVASAALHTLAGNAPTTAELEEALQYLNTAEGMELAPYLAENLAKSAPGYAALGETTGTAPLDPTAYPVDPSGMPVDPTMPSDPTAGIPTDGAPVPGGLEIVGQNEDGTYALSDGRTIIGQTEDGNLVVDDGSVLDPEGNEIAPAGTVPVNAPGTAPQGEIDPTTGKPVDPNAADAAADAPKEDGGVNVPGILLGTAAVAGGGALLYKKVIRPRIEARQAAAATPDAARPAATRTLTDDMKQASVERYQRSAARLEQSLANPNLSPQHRATQQRMLDSINAKLADVDGDGTARPTTTPQATTTPATPRAAGNGVDLAAVHRQMGQQNQLIDLQDDLRRLDTEHADARAQVRTLQPQADDITKRFGELQHQIDDLRSITYPTQREQQQLRVLEREANALKVQMREVRPQLTAAMDTVDARAASLTEIRPQVRELHAQLPRVAATGPNPARAAVQSATRNAADDAARVGANLLPDLARGASRIL